MIYNFFVDSKFRKPRIWSNKELIKFKDFFYGDALNVSGWQDLDKEGSTYRNKYFVNCDNYYISNFKSSARGYQGNLRNEFFLDLESNLPKELLFKFNIVFNHTTLEHVFNFKKAFENICNLSNDLVVIVVPFLQEEHGNYGDYWRFTSQSIKKLFEKNNMNLVYLNFNDNHDTSIYIFAIASKNVSTSKKFADIKNNKLKLIGKYSVGKNIIKNNILKKIYLYLSKNNIQ